MLLVFLMFFLFLVFLFLLLLLLLSAAVNVRVLAWGLTARTTAGLFGWWWGPTGRASR